MKVLHVVGARPNFIKIAPIMEEMARYPDQFEQVLVHTGQHYDERQLGWLVCHGLFFFPGWQTTGWIPFA